MNLYELVFIIRQDLSSADIDKVNSDVISIIDSDNLIKKEYWGLRNLSYPIKKNNKGHYVLVGFKSDGKILKELDRKIKLDESIVRHLVIKVDKIDERPSPILKNFENLDPAPAANIATSA